MLNIFIIYASQLY